MTRNDGSSCFVGAARNNRKFLTPSPLSVKLLSARVRVTLSARVRVICFALSKFSMIAWRSDRTTADDTLHTRRTASSWAMQFPSCINRKVAQNTHTYTLTIIFPRFQHLKNPSATAEADCRALTRLCLRRCIGVKLRAASVPSIAHHFSRATPVEFPPLRTPTCVELRNIYPA